MRKTDPEILIATSSLDTPSWLPVANKLASMGYEVLPYEADKVAFSEVSLDINIEGGRGLKVFYDGQPFQPEQFVAAWRRRPNMFMPTQIEWTKQFQIDEERRYMQNVLWSKVPENAWLNAPSRMHEAEDKLGQLLVAEEIGFDIPKTIVTNDWSTINTELPEDIILKMQFGVIYGKENIEALYTTRFTNTSHELPVEDNPFPGFWQPYHAKEREWRITVVGDRFFDAAIYTDQHAKDDWRRPENKQYVTYVNETFPDTYKEKCIQFLGHYALKFGAFDFIEDADGKITFLECNTNGQFIWLEQELDLPISNAIADELARIADSNKH